MNYDPNSPKMQAQPFSGYIGGGNGAAYGASPENIGLSQAGVIIERLGKQMAQIYECIEQRHGMIYGPVPKAVDNAKLSGGSGLLYELERLSTAADQISQLASSL